MKTAFKIFAFTVGVCVFYSYVGQMVPQQEAHPPETRQLSADMTTAELVAMGEEIVGGKGTCLTCHTIGEGGGALRFPDLAGIGAAAATRREGMSAVDYLAESLYEPNAYVVEGFTPGMPAVSRPPIDLSDGEILAVVAYLQSLGGTPTVDVDTRLAYAEDGPAAGASPPAQPAAAAGSAPAPQGASPEPEEADGAALFQAYLCHTCHSIDAPTTLVGPSLHDVGDRLTRAELYEALLEPDATVAEGFTAGLMPATLNAVGFEDEITPRQLKALVDFLASKKG